MFSLLELSTDLFQQLLQVIHRGRPKKADRHESQASHSVMLTSQDIALLAAL